VVENARDAQVFFSVLFDQCFIFIHLLAEVGHCALCRQQIYKVIALNIWRKIALRKAGDVDSVFGIKGLLPAVALELRRCV
jgi:hypothetical protein